MLPRTGDVKLGPTSSPLPSRSWGTLMMLGWVVIIAAAVWIALRANRDGGTRRAREILDERLASGELTPEEHRERREALR
jgi:uncharacterized membrane protein